MNRKRAIQQCVFGIAATIVGAASVFGQAVNPIKINEFVKQEGTQGTAAVNPDTREFLELYNTGASAFDLSGYTIRTTVRNTGAVTNDVIPGGSSITPNGYFVIAAQGRALDGVANYKIPIGVNEELYPDGVNLLIELLDGSSTLVDAVAMDAYRAPQLTGLSPDQLNQIGTGLQSRAESYNPEVGPAVVNTTMSYARYRNGIDTNKNGRDFGYLPVTPGASNALSLVAAHVVPNVDALAVGTRIPDYNAAFVPPRVIAPGTVDVANPKIIGASPQGGNAISAWDETGGGNVVYSKNYVNKFDLYAYLDTTDLNMNTDDWEAEWTAYGIGSTDPQFRTPNSNGLVPDVPQVTVSENGSTGIGWFYERFENTAGELDTNSFKLSLIDFGQGGNGVPAAQTADQWKIIQTFELTPADSGWHRLSVDYNPATGAVAAKFDSNTVNFVSATDQVGTFYAGYREGLTGVPAGTTDFVNRVRPATWDMVATVVADADFNDNGTVEGTDFLTWQKAYGGAGSPTTGDANGDGQVNDADYGIWKSKFGGAPATAAAGQVPEPAAGVLAAVSLIAWGLGSRRSRD